MNELITLSRSELGVLIYSLGLCHESFVLRICTTTPLHLSFLSHVFCYPPLSPRLMVYAMFLSSAG